MTDRAALLAGIAADPDDDLKRLVFADYLDDHCNTPADAGRAEFIRLQVAAAADPDPAAATGPAATRAAELFKQYRTAWLPHLDLDQRWCVRFERGFPAILRSVTPRGLFGPLDRPAGEVVLARSLELTKPGSGTGIDLARLARCKGLTRMRTVRVFGPDGGTATLLGSPKLNAAEDVELHGVGPAPVAAFWHRARDHGALPVRRLVLARCRSAWRHRHAPLPALEEVDVGESSDDIVRELIDSPVLGPVRRLTVAGPPDDLRPVAGGVAAPHLTELTAYCGAADDAALGRFLADLRLPRLTHLWLVVGLISDYTPLATGGTAVGVLDRPPTAAAAVAAGCAGGGLTSVALTGHPVPGATVIALLESPHLANLKRLTVETPAVPGHLADYLLCAPTPLGLDKLYLGADWVTAPDAGTVRGRIRARLGGRLQAYPDTPQVWAVLRRTGRL